MGLGFCYFALTRFCFMVGRGRCECFKRLEGRALGVLRSFGFKVPGLRVSGFEVLRCNV